MTHAELVKVAARWLRTTKRCGVVLTEHTAGREFPDAVGWRMGFSYLVECKVSRSDFLADLKKPSRYSPRLRPASMCWYLVPQGLKVQDRLPNGWGLLEWNGRCVSVVVPVCEEWESPRETESLRSEIYRLYQELRRYQAQGLKYLTITEMERQKAEKATA